MFSTLKRNNRRAHIETLFLYFVKHIGWSEQILVAVVDKDKCTGCETCVDQCPASSISIENEKAKVDKDMCVDCQTCVDVCPSEAIHME
jgi:ferredoxin